MSSHDDLVIGVDAGGTKTTAWLCTVGSESTDVPDGRGHAGPGNPRAVGMAAATQEITSAISRAFADAGLARAPAAGLCLCVAGAGRPDEQHQLTQWAADACPARRIVVTHDAAPILAAAAPDQTGIALISGTGSLAWGRNSTGREERAGGWGYLFGDEGSGYSIAIAGLRAATHSADGRGETTQLLDSFLQRFGISRASELIDSIYGSSLSRRQIAELADVVFRKAPEDHVAAQIIEDACNQLAALVTTVADQLQLADDKTALGLAGGVLIHQPNFRMNVISRTGFQPDRVTAVSEPVAGAMIIAKKEAVLF